MELLRRCAKFVIAGASLALVSCLVVEQFFPAPLPLAFPHAKHGEEAGLECASCHRKAATAAEAGMPTAKQCQLCHTELDEGKAPDHQAASLYEEKAVKASHFTVLTDEVKFSHQLHVTDQSIGCAECHGTVGAGDRVTADVRVGMDTCVACHERKGRSNDCATCHETLRADQRPASHASGWERLHGAAAQAHEGAALDSQCMRCHSRSACDDCHQNSPPTDHTNYWRRKGHAISVALDRDRCATCHRTDACDRCHQESAPISHLAGWGSPRDRHCTGCHLPEGAQDGCATCHQGTPSHAQAAPMPAGHTPGMNCRQCHGLTAPLPHPDKGDACSGCHR